MRYAYACELLILTYIYLPFSNYKYVSITRLCPRRFDTAITTGWVKFTGTTFRFRLYQWTNVHCQTYGLDIDSSS